MRNTLLLVLLVSAALESVAGGDPGSACVKKAGLGYEASHKVEPAYLTGDFDGDGKVDIAVLANRGRAQGVLVCLGTETIVLGAGTTFNYMKDLDFTAWKIHPKARRVAPGMGAGRPPVLLGDAFLLEWESGSGIVYWNGKRFVWYQQGD